MSQIKFTSSLREYLYRVASGAILFIEIVASSLCFSNSLLAQRIQKNDSTDLKEQELKSVEVVAFRKISKDNAEKSVYTPNLAGLLETAKADLALRRLPGVSYINDSYVLDGRRSSAKILLDGVEVSQERLKQIPATEIAKVEVYAMAIDTNGYEGAINIIRKVPNEALYYGDVSLSGSAPLGIRLSPNASYRSRKLELTASGSYNYSHQQNTHEVERNHQLTLKEEGKPKTHQYFGTIDLRKELSSKWLTAFSYLLWGFNSAISKTPSLPASALPYQIKEHYEGHYLNGLLSYKPDRYNRYYLKARYFFYRRGNESSLPPSSYLGRMNEFSSELRYERDSLSFLGLTHYPRLGSKWIYRDAPVQSNSYRTNIGQIYLSDFFYLTSRLSLQLAARAEWARDNYQRLERTHFALVPSAYLNYQSTLGRFWLYYAHTVWRPSIDYLNTEEVYINEYDRTKGNDQLRDSQQDQYYLGYGNQLGGGYLSLTAAYIEERDLVDAIFLESDRLSTYENVGKSSSFSLNMSYNTPLFANSVYLGIGLGVEHTDIAIKPSLESRALTKGNRGWGFSGRLSLSYASSSGWQADVSAYYKSINRELGYSSYSLPSISGSVQKNLFKNKLSLSLSAYTGYNNRTEYLFKNLQQTTRLKTDPLTVSLGVTLYLGKPFQKKAKETMIDNDDITVRRQQ